MLFIINFDKTVSLSDCIGFVSLILALIGGCFALIQWGMNMKLKRAEYIKNLLDEIRTNKDIVYYKFDYNEPWYVWGIKQSVLIFLPEICLFFG